MGVNGNWGEWKWGGNGNGGKWKWGETNWTKDTRDTKGVLKWVLVRIAAFCCARQYQIWTPEIEYYQKMTSHAQIRLQGAEKHLKKSLCGGGGW